MLVVGPSGIDRHLDERVVMCRYPLADLDRIADDTGQGVVVGKVDIAQVGVVRDRCPGLVIWKCPTTPPPSMM